MSCHDLYTYIDLCMYSFNSERTTQPKYCNFEMVSLKEAFDDSIRSSEYR